jgi:hypothetical protein
LIPPKRRAEEQDSADFVFRTKRHGEAEADFFQILDLGCVLRLAFKSPAKHGIHFVGRNPILREEISGMASVGES